MHAFQYRYKAIGIYWAERLDHDFEASSTEIGDLGDNISYVLKMLKNYSNYIPIRDEITQPFIRTISSVSCMHENITKLI